jgi:N-acetylglutamate synthase and related acetyltransferases
MEIKKINLSEVDSVVGLYNNYRVFFNQPSDENLARRFVSRQLQHNQSVIFLASVKNKNKNIPVGFVSLYPLNSKDSIKGWIINDLYVEPDYRDGHVGEALIKTAIAYAKDAGAMFVEVFSGLNDYVADRFDDPFINKPGWE